VSTEVALFTSAVLLATAAVALFSKRISVSLITLFYSSITLGIIFTIYNGVLVGLLHIITFAGAVSVLLLTAILMVGEPKLDMNAGRGAVATLGGVLVVVAVAAYVLFGNVPTGVGPTTAPPPAALLQFIWLFRPWDLLILLMVFASAMIVVVNLFSQEEH
jgi:NADH:ubiquinone oxidoreductase subunit 6 (subunit J)